MVLWENMIIIEDGELGSAAGFFMKILGGPLKISWIYQLPPQAYSL